MATFKENKEVTTKQDRFDKIASEDAGKKLRLVTEAEENHYKQLKLKLDKDKEGDFTKDDVHHIISHMIHNRTKYKKYVSY